MVDNSSGDKLVGNSCPPTRWSARWPITFSVFTDYVILMLFAAASSPYESFPGMSYPRISNFPLFTYRLGSVQIST